MIDSGYHDITSESFFYNYAPLSTESHYLLTLGAWDQLCSHEFSHKHVKENLQASPDFSFLKTGEWQQ
jgi:hypothetical protein